MNLQLLRTFVEVVEQGSMTAAASRLGYTQPAVSRHVAALEQDLGTPLLLRGTRGVTPTEHGTALVRHATAILRHRDDLRRELASLDSGAAGRLRVAAFPTAVAALVPTALAGFRTAHPAVSVSLTEGTTPRLLDELATGDVDVAVVSAPPDRPLNAEGLDLTRLLDERLRVAVAESHRLRRRRSVRLAELRDDPFVTGSASDEPGLLRARLPPGFDPVVDIVVADWTGKLGCVAAGLGVALVPELATRAVPAGLRLLRIRDEDAPVRRVFAATDPERASAAHRAFVRDLRAAAAGLA